MNWPADSSRASLRIRIKNAEIELTNYEFAYIIRNVICKWIKRKRRIMQNSGNGRQLRCGECGAVFEPWDELYSWDFGGGA